VRYNPKILFPSERVAVNRLPAFLAVLGLALFAISWCAIACSSPTASVATAACKPEPKAKDAGAHKDVVDSAAADRVTPSDGGGPRLASLAIAAASDASREGPLVPEFSPETFDYYVRCSATGSNAFTVSMTAAPGFSSELFLPKATAPETTQTVVVSVSENDAIVALATAGKTTTEYWVRCLPPDMPEWLWTPHPENGTVTPGYYMVGNLYRGGGEAGYALILNSDGVPVWYERAPTGFGVGDVDSIAPGVVSFLPFTNVGINSFRVRVLDPLHTTLVPTAALVAKYETNLHELKRLANGDTMVIGQPYTYGVDLTGIDVLGVPAGMNPSFGTGSVISDCALVELDPAGRVVWTWLASDHFDATSDSTLPYYYGTAPDGGTAVDVFHCNSIDVDPASGNLLVSARNMSSVFYIDRGTGKVLWKMGGYTPSKDNAAYVSVADPFTAQHDAHFHGWSSRCNGGSGQITLFDDESGTCSPSRAVVYNVSVGSGSAACDSGAPAGKAEVEWQYVGPGTASVSGSFRISEDGSRVIGWGSGATYRRAFSEVDLAGNVLLDFGYSDNEPSYRAIKVPLQNFDLEVLRRTAGLP
jgi:Arylsulfotransferase (ASST)